MSIIGQHLKKHVKVSEKKKRLLLFLLLVIPVTLVDAENFFINPVIKPADFSAITSAADPFVFKDSDGTYYCYVTGTGFPVFSSRDLVNWVYEGKAMPKKYCTWATQTFWAPEVVKRGDNYYLHYTGAPDSGQKQIGLAVSKSPLGPFVDVSNEPFYTNGTKECIDSHIFFDDDGRVYMYFSNAASSNTDPVSGKKMSEIWAVEIEPDLSGIKGTAQFLIKPTQSWEYSPSAQMYWNEGAAVLKHNGIYYLMYSANCYCNGNYSMGYATSISPLGPFTKYAGNPVLSNTGLSDLVSGTGHHCVTTSPDGIEMICVYHSHVSIQEKGGTRQINIDRMGFRDDGTLYVEGPTVSPQPYPTSLSGTGINNMNQDVPELKVVPNPVKKNVQVCLPSENETLISIFNLSGQLLYTVSSEPPQKMVEIPLGFLEKGMYFLISSEPEHITGKATFIKSE